MTDQEIRKLKLERDQLLRAVKMYRLTLKQALQSLNLARSAIKSDLASYLTGPLVDALGELKDQLEETD